MKSTNTYSFSATKALPRTGLTLLLLAIGQGSAQADNALLLSTAIDTQTPLADSFVFSPISSIKNIHSLATITTPIKATYVSSSYTFDDTQLSKDNPMLISSFENSKRTATPLKMITDRKQQNYLALGSRVSTPFINGVYAYLSYHPVETNNPHDTSRLLSLGGRLEF